MSWRESARRVIEPILAMAQADGWDEGRIKRALFDAYPFGMRKYTPYKIWLDEIKRCRGTKTVKGKDQLTARLFT